MKRFIFRLSLGMLCAWALCGTPGAWAQTAPPFERSGTIDRLDVKADVIVISDGSYILPASTRVYTYDPKGADGKDAQEGRGNKPGKDRNALKEGMSIGYRVEGEAAGTRGTITEVWIVPAGTLAELRKTREAPANPNTSPTEQPPASAK